MATAHYRVEYTGPAAKTATEQLSLGVQNPAGSISTPPGIQNETDAKYVDDATTTSSESDFEEFEHCDCLTETSPSDIPYVSVYETEKEVKERGYFTAAPTAAITNVERDTYSSVHLINRYIYAIELKHGKHQWIIYRRFSDFRDLNRKLMFYRAGSNLAAPVHRIAERREERRLKAHTLKHRDAGRTESSGPKASGPGDETDDGAASKSDKPNTVRVEKTIRLPAPDAEQHDHPQPRRRLRPCKLPRFPLLPDTAVSQERLEQRKEELIRFLSAVLHVPAYRNHSATLEFLGVSRLSFVAGLGLKSEEGFIKKRPGNANLLGGVKRFCVTRVAPWRKRWLILKDSYLVYLRPKKQEISEVILFENCFGIDGDSTGSKGKTLTISNLHSLGALSPIAANPAHLYDDTHNLKRSFDADLLNAIKSLNIKCPHEWDADAWRHAVSMSAQSIGSIWLKENRFQSSYPIREESFARWFVDGRTYMEEAANMILMAKEDIFITDWWLSPEIFLKRPATDSESSTWRLDMLLKRKAEQGVKVFVLLYKEVTMALTINSFYSKAKLQSLHPNIKVQRHRGAMNWAHHEKLIVIDQTIAFVGGIDLCYGRWDDHQHKLGDMAGLIVEETICLQEGELAGKLLDGLASYKREKAEAEETTRETTKEQKDSADGEQNVSLKKAASRWDQILPQVKGAQHTPAASVEPDTSAPAKERRVSKAKVFISEWKSKAKERKRRREERIDESDEDDEEAIAAAADTKIELTGNEKWWIGKDYVNFIFKDFLALDAPFTDFIDRRQTPRMPWHDIASVVYGVAARDVARHFIERWNMCKVEKYHENPDKPFLLPKSYDNIEIPKKVKRRAIGCKVQIIRSASFISTGRKSTENSIYQAYVHAIETAEHYVYIENQFFVSQVGPGKVVHNGIAQALFDRIVKAHKNNESFKVYVVMPLLPGFEIGTALFTVLHWTYLSINKGPNSLLRNLETAVGDPSRYVSFCSLRKYDTLGERLVTELIYIHSKLLIADDRMVIIGSANINDRSQMGDRDSEVAIFVEDTQFDETTMNGKPGKSGHFAGSLRRHLFREHLGLLEGSSDKSSGTTSRDDVDVTDPASDTFFSRWKEIAQNNSHLFEEVFDCLPNDNVKSQAQLEQYRPGNAECVTDKRHAEERIKGIQGYLVSFPLDFLINSDLTPPLNTKEGWAPSKVFI